MGGCLRLLCAEDLLFVVKRFVAAGAEDRFA
jgi:hypothetical protein